MPFCSFMYKSNITGSPQGDTHFNINYLILVISWAFLVAQLIKNPPTMQETRFNSWVGKIPWRRDRLSTPVFLGFPHGSAGKESACNVGDLGSILGLGRYPGEANSCPLQYSGLENSMDCSPPGSSVHGNSPGKNIGVGLPCSLLQGILSTEGLNLGLPVSGGCFII